VALAEFGKTVDLSSNESTDGVQVALITFVDKRLGRELAFHYSQYFERWQSLSRSASGGLLRISTLNNIE